MHSIESCTRLYCDVGFVGKTDWDQARGDMIADYIDDMRAPLVQMFSEADEDRKVDIGAKTM